MIAEFHLLRPFWFLTLIPLFLFFLWMLKRNTGFQAWSGICDKHLLEHLVHQKSGHKKIWSLGVLLWGVIFLIVALSGPTWSRYPVPVYKQAQPRVLVLDMSHSMLTNDLPPNRLSRAKYKLRDLFDMKDSSLYGLVVYTSEPFIASPITEDSKTITSLLAMLTPNIMPVQGQNLGAALKEAGLLIKQGGYQNGDILILTGALPSKEAISEARLLLNDGIHTSVLPVMKEQSSRTLFQQLAKAGGGLSLTFSNTSQDIEEWLSKTNARDKFEVSMKNEIPIWKDQGRWFLIPALILLLPLFRRGWIQRLSL